MIAHFDVDAFYASVAQRDDPSLRGKPIVVAWTSRRSVVLTASYEARPYGIRSAMPLFKARSLNPEVLVVAPNFELYRDASRAIFEIIRDGALTIEGLSLDEAYAEIGPVDVEEATAYARRVRERVRAEVGLTISAGVAAQKMVAKIASDEAKPDGLKIVAPGDEASFLAPMPIGRLWGVGPKTQRRLEARGVETIGALAALSDEHVIQLFGRMGKEFRELARGIDNREVSDDRETRSVSSEMTFEYDVLSETVLRDHLRELASDVAERLRAHELRSATIGVKLKRADFTIVQRQLTLAEPVDDAESIYAAAARCLDRAGVEGIAIRLLGVRAASLEMSGPVQARLF